jgi:hypothetical protein
MIAGLLLALVIVIVVVVLGVLFFTRRKGVENALRDFAVSQGGRWHAHGDATRPSFGVGPDEQYLFALEFPRQGVPVVALQGSIAGSNTSGSKAWHSVRVAAPMTPRLCLCKIGPIDPPDHPLAQRFVQTRLLGVDRVLPAWPVPDPVLRPLIAVYAADAQFAGKLLTPAFLHWFAREVPPLAPMIDIGGGIAQSYVPEALSLESLTVTADRLLAVIHTLGVRQGA